MITPFLSMYSSVSNAFIAVITACMVAGVGVASTDE
jgi:hypothetical protein